MSDDTEAQRLARVLAGESAPQRGISADDFWPVRLAKGLWSGATLPGDVLTGRASASDPDYQERVMGLSGLGMTGQIPRVAQGAVRQAPAREFDWQTFAAELERQAASRAPLTASERAGIGAENLRRQMGVQARTEEGQKFDALIKQIEDAIKLGPGK